MRCCFAAIPVLIMLVGFGCAAGEDVAAAAPDAALMSSRVLTIESDQRVLMQELTVDAPLDAVWRAYTTEDGWTAWAAPKAQIDFRVGGTIRTAYQGEVGGPNTDTLRIRAYVPQRLLSLQADLSRNRPEVMKQDADNLSNIIVFDDLGDGRVRVQSYGVGYSDTPAYDELMQFFIDGNERLHAALKRYLEDGERTAWPSGG